MSEDFQRTREALRALSGAATPGEWYAVEGVVSVETDRDDDWTRPRPVVAAAMGRGDTEDQAHADAVFIAAAVNYVRAAIEAGP